MSTRDEPLINTTTDLDSWQQYRTHSSAVRESNVRADKDAVGGAHREGVDLADWTQVSSGPAWGASYGQVDALLWMRESRLDDEPVVVDANTGATFLSTSDLDSGFAPGIRATVGTRLCNGKSLELSYLGLFPNDASATAISPDADAFLIFPDNFFGNVFVGMSGAMANYSTSMNGLAASLIGGDSDCECGDSCADNCGCEASKSPLSFGWIAGLR